MKIGLGRGTNNYFIYIDLLWFALGIILILILIKEMTLTNNDSFVHDSKAISMVELI